ncbi:type II CAAX prenyl endopeptidase Rce1 family protein [Phycisphaerales bacterium AB-hyl4]|uniref:Type II CAAX prenyl endopeptidase Rce1 family protein n=1 Tax=Natronomicrosphaera hydrolytica TaxID=3242702 RepID=A0ABV4U0B6_9BACT
MTRSNRNPKSEIRNSDFSTYWERTHWPLQSLYFLLPLIIVYELGVVLLAGEYDITARRLLRTGFEWFGVTGYYLPGLLVVVFLLSAHFVRRDPWEPEPKLWGMMWVESLALAVPLFVFTLVLFREPVAQWMLSAVEPGALTAKDGVLVIPDWSTGVVFSIGAGIYEELLFRLIAIALLHLLLVDLLGLPEHIGAVAAVVISAVAFALYHFPEPNPWHWEAFVAGFDTGRFIFYTVAGVYLAAVYVLRGFGIVAATHAMYDVFVVTALFMVHETV